MTPKRPLTRLHAEDDHGLYVKGRLFLEVQRAREAYVLLKNGALDGLSIGYIPTRVTNEGMGRVLTEVALHEISLVTFPANSSARVQQVKTQKNNTALLWTLNEELQRMAKILKG